MRRKNQTIATKLLRGWALRMAGLALLAFGILGAPTQSEAKLDPYYILTGQSFGQFKPRILFAVDTSGSMTWLPSWPDWYAVRPTAEDDNPATSSRVHGARRAINKVVQQTQSQANFSLMAFGHVRPPQNQWQVPNKCEYNGTGYRFWWVSWTTMGGGWQPLWNDFGGQGTWQLCGDNRPYAYLRHDNLGGFNIPNNQQGDPPPAPLVKSVADYNAFTAGANWSRNVQFFPQFMGVRRNLDCNDASDKSLVDRSYGDYGNAAPTRDNNICGRDFYYWPYVDGFPGYSSYTQYSNWLSWRRECDVYETCAWTYTDRHQAGHHRRTYTYHATLFAPFFSQAAIDSMAIPQSAKGPRDEDEAANLVLGLTGDTDEGGLDAANGTPWATSVGDPDWYVTKNGNQLTPKLGAIPQSNAPFSHTTITSYLSLMMTISSQDLCVPTAAVLISDGQPSPWSTEGGTTLYSRLRKIRAVLGVKTYMVGFSDGFLNNATAWSRLQGMACAAAGSTDVGSPCSNINNSPYNWDTCRDPNDPANGCAWEAGDPDELATALTEIVNGVIETPVPSGPGSAISDFVPIDPQDQSQGTEPVQTTVSGYTETPSWKGHVERAPCDTYQSDDPLTPQDESLLLEPACVKAAQAPDPGPATEDYSDGGQTGCTWSRTWDAGECLKNKVWNDRRLYSSDANNNVYQISKADGTATAKFRNELDGQGLLTPGQEQQEADDIAAFLLGKNAPDDWKLSGLATSTPILVRKIPERNLDFAPSVGIRDPHCAGRVLSPNQEVHGTLRDFADDAHDEDLMLAGSFGKHWEYEEAVVVGTDMGLLHAFHFDTGNELFAYLPQNLLSHAAELAANGAANYGQPTELDQHLFGVSSTINQTWVYDESLNNNNGGWRHLAIFGFGKGGTEYVALDLSHMGRLENGFPLDVLWTTWSVSDPTWKALYEQGLGETWSRPAISYAVPNQASGDLSQPPKAYVVFASGYPEKPGLQYQGHAMFMVDAVTGETEGEYALFPQPANASQLYDDVDDYALVPDPAIATQCVSKYWGEMQEAYLADPYGQLFRWDFGWQDDISIWPTHEDDSVGVWSNNADQAMPLFQFKACQGTGASCSVANSNRGDVFTHAPAVVASDRIDDQNEVVYNFSADDQYLLALNSGSPMDDVLDGGDPTNDFHSSLYLIVDNHRKPNDHAGLTVPGIGGLTAPGTDAAFMRQALWQLQRQRYVEYPDGTIDDENTAPWLPFNKKARPIRAPRIDVTAVLQPGTQDVAAEIYYISFLVYEPGENICDPRWNDGQEWVFDAGSTYEITYRLDVEPDKDIDFINGSGVNLPDLGDGFAGVTGLSPTPKVEQIRDGDCADGNCGPQSPPGSKKACDPNDYIDPSSGSQSIPMGWAELDGFSPLEIPVP